MSLHAIVEKAKKEGTQITPSPYVPRAGDIIWSGRGTKRTVNLVMNGGDKIMVNRTDTSGCVQENLPLLVQNVIEGMVSGATDRIERDGEVIFSFAPPSIDAPAPLPALLPQAVIAASVSAIESNI
jgi:hypothetical protein